MFRSDIDFRAKRDLKSIIGRDPRIPFDSTTFPSLRVTFDLRPSTFDSIVEPKHPIIRSAKRQPDIDPQRNVTYNTSLVEIHAILPVQRLFLPSPLCHGRSCTQSGVASFFFDSPWLSTSQLRLAFYSWSLGTGPQMSPHEF